MSLYPLSVWAPTTKNNNDVIQPAHINDAQAEVVALETQLLAAPTSYTPSWTATSVNPAIGNGSITGSYSKHGKIVKFEILITMGSTTTFGSGAWRLTTPSAMSSTPVTNLFTALLTDTGTANYPAVGLALTTTTFELWTHAAANQVFSTQPHTWASTDVLRVTGWYVEA
jgi:hypothetical protein